MESKVEFVRGKPVISMENKKFGFLTVIKYSHSDSLDRFYECKCDCGECRIVRSYELRKGRVKRCKHCKKKLHQEQLTTHSMKGTSIYNIWMGIKARCLNPKNRAYKNYGARGISLSEEWKKFENFYKDMGDRPKGMQIDRINNDLGYYKENCRWATPKENCNNRRNNK